MNTSYSTLIENYAKAVCSVGVCQQGPTTEITLYTRLDPSEQGMPEIDISSLATYIASWSWPEYRYEEKRTLYRLKGWGDKDKVRVVLHVQVEQRLSGEEVELLSNMGKYPELTNTYRTLVC
jgi:hypothetical protein